MKYRLTRLAEVKRCTLGMLIDESMRHRFATMERPWRDNRPDVSCIPPGIYLCAKYRSKKFGDTFIVKDVPGRSGILFHEGNVVADTRGCICPGLDFAMWGDGWAVTKSFMAMEKLRESLRACDEFTLEIVTSFPPQAT